MRSAEVPYDVVVDVVGRHVLRKRVSTVTGRDTAVTIYEGSAAECRAIRATPERGTPAGVTGKAA